MGRQIAIVTSWKDELELLEFLAADSELRICRCSAETRAGLWIHDWRSSRISDDQYAIWPTCFPWKPRYAQTIKRDRWYISNDGDAPLLEVSRHSHGKESAGRLYWAKFFMATEPLGYDVAKFDELVDRVWRW